MTPKTDLSAACLYMCVGGGVKSLLTDALTVADSCTDKVFKYEYFRFFLTHIYRKRADSSILGLNCQQLSGGGC